MLIKNENNNNNNNKGESKKRENKDILKLTNFYFNHHNRWSSKEMHHFIHISNFLLFASLF